MYIDIGFGYRQRVCIGFDCVDRREHSVFRFFRCQRVTKRQSDVMTPSGLVVRFRDRWDRVGNSQ